MNINVGNGISVSVSLLPVKNKTDKTKYAIYMTFAIYNGGLKQFQPKVSTGITTNVTDWNKGEVKGRNERAKTINERLNDYTNRAKEMLVQLSMKNIKTPSEVLKEIKLNAKQTITGKAAKGLKNNLISKLQQYSYENILERYLAEKQLSKDRKRNYLLSIKLMNEYFENDVPNINLITREDLDGIKKLIHKKFPNQNTASTRLCQIAAIFKYAQYIGIININPLPNNFRGCFQDGNRAVLSENDCLKIIHLKDDILKQTHKVAKYSLLVQMLTGIGYGDLKSIKYENIKYDENTNQYYIDKKRNKTGVVFIVNLTSNAKHCVDKLKDLTGNEEQPFNLPSIEYMIRMYKEIGKLADVSTKITTYTLRHTFAVDFIEKDGRLEDLQKRLGHTDLKTTQIYGKISAKRNAETTSKLEQLSIIHRYQAPDRDILKAV